MPLDLGPQCCDASNYIAIGCACATRLDACWNPLRPIGAGLYFSLPFRLGLTPGSLVLFNLVWVFVSVLAGVWAASSLMSRSSRVLGICLGILFLAIHACFFGRTIANSLSDIPAAVLAMLSIWFLVVGGAKDRAWLYGAAGAALGLGAITRAFYLYPGVIAIGCLFVMAFLGRLQRARAALAAVLFLIPVALQCGATHAHTGAWSFIDPEQTAAGEREHFANDLYGYDTVFDRDSLHEEYRASQCFSGSDVMSDAIRKGDFRAVGCLFRLRQWFYLGSFVPGGRTYLSHSGDRRFSPLYFVVNAFVLLAGAAWALGRRRRARLLLVPLSLLAATWVEASFIMPESRFVLVLHIVLWMLAATAVLDRASSRVGWRALESKAAKAPLGPRFLTFLASLAPPSGELRVAGAVAFVTLAVQGSALGADFGVDDLRYLYESQSLAAAGLTHPCAGSFCATFRLAAASMHWAFGLHASWFRAVVLLTHVATVVLLFGTTRALGGPRWAAGIGAVLWGSAPAYQGTLQRYSEYPDVIAACTTALSLFELARAAAKRESLTTPAVLRVNLALLAGAAAAPSGCIAALALPALVLLLPPRESSRAKAALLLVPAALAGLLLLLRLSVGRLSSIAMTARLVTDGLGALVAGPISTMNADGSVGIFRWSSPGLATAADVSVLLLFIAAVAWRFARGDSAERRILVGLIGLAMAMYGVVALRASGPASAVSVTPDHYGSSLGFVIAGALSFGKIPPRLLSSSKRVAMVALGGLGAWLMAGTAVARNARSCAESRAEWSRDWGDVAVAVLRRELMSLPKDYVLAIRNDAFPPGARVDDASTRLAGFPGIGAYWIAARGPGPINGRRVRFVEADGGVLDEIRTEDAPAAASMFLSPDEAVRAGGLVVTLAQIAPPTVASYLMNSKSPRRARADHEKAAAFRAWLDTDALFAEFPRRQGALQLVCPLPGYDAASPADLGADDRLCPGSSSAGSGAEGEGRSRYGLEHDVQVR